MAILSSMLGPDALADVEGDAQAIYAMARADEEEPPSVAELACALLGREPGFGRIEPEAKLRRLDDAVLIREGVAPARARWLAAHEIAEWYYEQRGYDAEDREARCDALGASLVVPRRALLAAIEVRGHRVHLLAEDFATTQSLMLLRIGEVTGRPVLLMRWPDPIQRGRPFAWPHTMSDLVRALRANPGVAHPVPIRDEPNRHGFMVERGYV